MTVWASLVVDHIGQLVTMDGSGPDGLGIIEDAVVVVDGPRIAWLGPRAALPVPLAGVPTIDAGGRCTLPGLIDCHTHLVFTGQRADEFARRARGESYAQIMAAGGGIRSTMRAVRAATVEELVAATRPRLASLLAQGVTTVEVKSGYGLDVEHELKMLEAIRVLKEEGPWDIVPTLLAAHAIPPEFDDNADGWIDAIITELLPEVARGGLATACDVFVERGAFSVAQGRRLLRAAQDRGLGARVHAEQLSRLGGAQLAAEVSAWSAGHLEHVVPEDMEALARAEVVCEILAVAQAYVRDQRPIPGRALADAGCALAVASDCNPGTAHSTEISLAGGLAVTQAGLTAEEALRGLTAHAARALGLADRGVLAPGKRADLCVLEASSPWELLARWGGMQARCVVARGRVVVGQVRAG